MLRRSKYENGWYSPATPLGGPVADWRNQRPATIIEKCCNCGWCALYCPTGCIKEAKDGFERDLAFCKGCGICARECPARAIIMVEEEVS